MYQSEIAISIVEIIYLGDIIDYTCYKNFFHQGSVFILFWIFSSNIYHNIHKEPETRNFLCLNFDHKRVQVHFKFSLQSSTSTHNKGYQV